jgi:hypothetical protein
MTQHESGTKCQVCWYKDMIGKSLGNAKHISTIPIACGIISGHCLATGVEVPQPNVVPGRSSPVVHSVSHLLC